MDINEYIQAIESMKERLTAEIQDRILLASAFTMKAEMIDRVFNRGESTSGTPIGTYSTKPIYATKEKFVRKGAFQKQGKNASGNFQNGNERKSMYLKGGYSELREIQARQTSYVDLKVGGSLEKSINVLKDGKYTVIAITSSHESDKRKGNEARFGKPIFTPANSDVEVFNNAVIDEINHTFSTLIT